MNTFNLAPLRTEGSLQDWETGEIIADPKAIAEHQRRSQLEFRRKEAIEAAEQKLLEAVKRYHKALCDIERKYG